MKNSRRKFIQQTLLATTGMATGKNLFASPVSGAYFKQPSPLSMPDKTKICIFSKHLQWLNYG
jgi:hypothetical protein